jgi:5'-3' exonuclease
VEVQHPPSRPERVSILSGQILGTVLAQRVYLDGNSIGHAAQHGTASKAGGGKLYAGDQETTAIFGFLRSLHKLLRSRQFSRPIVLWDGRSWRYSVFPDYKSARSKTTKQQGDKTAYKSQAPHICRALHLLGVSQLISYNMEADDLAAILTQKAVAKGDTVGLITGDQDWLQLVQPGVVWIDHKVDRKGTVANFHELTGYRTTKAFVHSKAMQGDSGDSVPGCGGIGPKGAKDLLDVFDDVHAFQALDEATAKDKYFQHHAKPIPQKLMNLLTDRDTIARFEQGLGLMDLFHPDIPKPTDIKGTKAPLNRPAFEALCSEFGFFSLLKDMDHFISPFIALEEEFNS